MVGTSQENEKEEPVTVDYDELVKSWSETATVPAEAKVSMVPAE